MPKDVKAESAQIPSPRPPDARRDRWTAHRAARRRELVQAAVRALAIHGPDVGIDDVAREAGVTKPVLYRHFTDKAGLFEAVGQYGTELLLERLIPAMNSEEAVVPRIRKSLDAFFSVIEEYPNVYRLLTRGRAVDRTGGREAGADSGAHVGAEIGASIVAEDKELIAAALARLLGDYLRAFAMDSGAAEPWAHGLVGMVQNTGEWWLERRSMSRDSVVEYLTQLIWSTIDGITRAHGVTLDPNQPLELNKVVQLRREGEASG